MARLLINDEDHSKKLKEFSLACNKCNSKNVTLDIDWAAYTSGSWCKVSIICENCKKSEEIYCAGSNHNKSHSARNNAMSNI